MSEQQGSIADEAARLFGAVQQRVVRGVVGTATDAATGRTGKGPREDDVWSRVTSETEEPSPIDRIVDFSRAAAPRVAGHLFQAGTALFAVGRDLVEAYDRTRPPPRASETNAPAVTDGDPWSRAADEPDSAPRPGTGRGDDPGIEHIDIE